MSQTVNLNTPEIQAKLKARGYDRANEAERQRIVNEVLEESLFGGLIGRMKANLQGFQDIPPKR